MNIKHKKYAVKGACLLSLFVFLFVGACQTKQKKATVIVVENRTPFIQLEALYLDDLSRSISHLDSLGTTHQISKMRQQYLAARSFFKKAEPVLSFVDSENYKFLNQPNIIKVDEDDFTDIKVKKPHGFQVLEENLYVDSPDLKRVHAEAKLVVARMRVVKESTKLDYLKAHHFLWMLRRGIIRVALTGITGFDSPVLENSLEEAAMVYQSLQRYLDAFKVNFSNTNYIHEWDQLLVSSMQKLQGDFNAFDRYEFIKENVHPALVLWNATVKDWQVKFPFTQAIQNEATSLFSQETFSMSYFSSESFEQLEEEKVALGKQLFQEKMLSKNGAVSCATCHLPELQYTDGKKIAKGVKRNSPTLLYAALQKGMFYDKRAGSLEGQIVSVVANKNEFHSDLESMKGVVAADTAYVKAFEQNYKDGVSEQNIRNAIAMFVRSLTPFDSKFDRNINDLENTLTTNEINGFNLFNGKGKCATCHFAPVFNGTVPTSFQESEMEFIGVPQKNDTINAEISSDLGRYDVYKTPERKHFFKTPTVRNSAKTAPYMHNGVYTNLAQLIDFYNRGGGVGIGIDSEYQTLPPDPLELTQQEQQDIIAFLETLSDPVEQEDTDY